MASPFIENPVDLRAKVIWAALRHERLLRDCADPLAFPDEILYERYRFSAEGIRYICSLIEPSVRNATRRSCALTVGPTGYVALHFFVNV